MNTKEIIKETILDLLDEHSADEITVKLICMESGLSKQTLYNHYHNWMDANDEQTVTAEKGWQYSGIVNWSKGTEKRFCTV